MQIGLFFVFETALCVFETALCVFETRIIVLKLEKVSLERRKHENKRKDKAGRSGVKKIDAVDIGADQKANILIKKRGGAEEPKGNFFKRFFNAFCDSLGVNSEEVRKSMEDEATSFDDVMNEKKIYDVRDQIWNACNSLEQSIVSILLDKECEDKQAAIAQSIDQFKAFSDDASKSWIKLERAATDKEDTVVAE